MGIEEPHLESVRIILKGSKKILFVVYGGGHVNMILPVIKLLMQQTNTSVDVFALTTARKVLEQEGVPCFSCRDLPLSARARKYGEKLFELMQGGHHDIPEEESIAYLGLSFECLVEEHGEHAALILFEQKGRQAFLPISLMEDLVQRGQYNMIVATNSPRMEQAAIIAAGNIGISSVCLVDLFALQEVAWIGKKGYADKVCVLAESVKRMLCEAGRLDSEVIVTGNPVFDRLANPTIKQEGLMLRKHKGWLDKKVILWCSQPEPRRHPFTGEEGDPELPFRIEQQLKNICDDCGWHLVVRPHPSEDTETRNYIDGVEHGQKEDLHPLLFAVDIVTTMSSTVGLEAALLGQPVVSFNMSVFSQDMPFSAMGLAYGVDHLDDLKNALQDVLNKGFDCKGNLPSVGTASENVCREIMLGWEGK